MGTDVTHLRELVAYWADEFDWSAREADLGGLPASARRPPGWTSMSCTPAPPHRRGPLCRWCSATAGATRSGGTRRSSIC
ncbi:epoxide hydrolase N-terminal domain-containing protein [Streptomyces werraensis]|uniref:epoxide hydrolase N-terminal domain-containing protein n=1 Tax=Streptomyces werraensis TaxID=68284 RepID=UPI003B5118F1